MVKAWNNCFEFEGLGLSVLGYVSFMLLRTVSRTISSLHRAGPGVQGDGTS